MRRSVLSPQSSVLVVAGVIFFALGLMNASIGPALPDLARANGRSLAEVGALFTALFLGSIVSQAVSGWLRDRFGYGPVLAVGILMLAVGLGGVTLSHWFPATLGVMVFGGLGDGALVVAANLMIGESFAGRSVSVLNLLNVFFGLGAISGPLLAGVSAGVFGTALPTLWLVGLVMLPLLPLLRGIKTPAGRSLEAEDGAGAGPWAILRSPALWCLGGLLLLYVGSEIGTGNWSIAYMERSAALPAGGAALVASGFWLALSAGRVAGAILGTRLTPDRVMVAGLAGALLGGVLLAVSTGSGALTVAAILLLGLAFGPIYPTTLAIVTGRFRTGTAAGAIITVGSVGGLVLPWLHGVLIEGPGPRVFALFTAGATLAMMGFFLAWRWLARAGDDGRRAETGDDGAAGGS